MDTLTHLGQSQVRLRLDQGEHVRLDRFGHLAPNPIPRLRNTHLLPSRSPLPAQFAHILPTDTKALGEHTATTLAALICFQNPYPKIIRIGSSHRCHRGYCARDIQNYS